MWLSPAGREEQPALKASTAQCSTMQKMSERDTTVSELQRITGSSLWYVTTNDQVLCPPLDHHLAFHRARRHLLSFCSAQKPKDSVVPLCGLFGLELGRNVVTGSPELVENTKIWYSDPL